MNKDSQNEKDFLKEVAPTLFDHKLTVDDAPPSGYFEKLPTVMLDRVRQDARQPATKPIGVLRNINFSNVAIAAGLAVLLALAPVIRQWQSNSEAQPTAPATITYSATEVEEAYAEMLEGYPEADEWILETEMVELIAVATITEGVSTEELEEYLIEEGLNEELIFEAYFEQN